jgi:Aromatic-ring-opening dioxygenase LigAB, LigA subunit
LAHTAALGELIQQLHTDQALQEQFKASPQDVCDQYELTAHEHDAMVDRDCDDLVGLGVADSAADLPDALGCGRRGPDFGDSLVDRLKAILQGLRNRLPKVFDRLPIPPRG